MIISSDVFIKIRSFLILSFLLCLGCKYRKKAISNDELTGVNTDYILQDTLGKSADSIIDHQLFEAAGIGNIVVVKELLSKGASPDAQGEGYTNHDASGEVKNSSKQWTALMIAAYRNHLDVIKLLIASGANVTAYNAIGYTALHYACQSNYGEVAEFLLKNNAADYDTTKVPSGIPLYWALNYENEKLANALINLGENINYWDEETDRTILINAFYNKLPDIGNKLIKQGADVNARGRKNGETALMWASAYNFTESVKLLLANNANVNAESKSYYTALAFSAGNDSDDVSIPQLLLTNNAIININKQGRNPLIEAAGSKNIRIAKLLLSNGADPNQRAEHFGYISPLHEAVSSGDFQMTQLLVEQGADVNLLTNNGSGILLEAVWKDDNIHIVRYLLEKGADVNKANDDGQTPLLKSISYNEPEIIKLLMKWGADIHAIDVYGRNAISLAKERKDKDLLKLVKSYY